MPPSTKPGICSARDQGLQGSDVIVRNGFLIFFNDFQRRGIGTENLFEDGIFGIQVGSLFQIPYGDVVAEYDAAAFGGVFACNDL